MPTAHVGPPQWITRSTDESAVQQLVDELACPKAIAQLLVSRSISDPVAAKTFFAPALDDLSRMGQYLGRDGEVLVGIETEDLFSPADLVLTQR